MASKGEGERIYQKGHESVALTKPLLRIITKNTPNCTRLAETCIIMQDCAMQNLNNPELRQDVLRQRLDTGTPLVVADLAAELGISIDTVRRDLIALEQQGQLRRVRGGAVPTSSRMPNYFARASAPDPSIEALADTAVKLIEDGSTVFLDAGTTMNIVATRISHDFNGLIITPAPSVALAALSKGIRVHMIGGSLCPEGAMATGGVAETAVRDCAADLCLLGACGLWPEFGLSAEDAGEAGVKRAMASASARVAVVASAEKLQRRGRHRVLFLDEIDTLISDVQHSQLGAFDDAGVEVLRV